MANDRGESTSPDPRRDKAAGFVKRNWRVMEALDQKYWPERIEQEGAGVALQAAQALWLHMKTVNPSWPAAGDRKSDLDAHIALKRLLDRAAHERTAR